MKKILIFGFVSFFLMVTFGATGEERPREIVLVSEERVDTTNRDGTGKYWDLVRAVYEPLGIKTKFIIRSYRGSVHLVKTRRADALVGAHLDVIEGALFPKYPFDRDVVTVLFKKERVRQWNGQESLRGRKVAWIKDYAFDEHLDVPIVKLEFFRREDILRRLDRDQVDFFMDVQKDLEAVLNKNIIDITKYTVETVMDLDVYLAFADTDKGKKLKEIFEVRYPKLLQSGEMDRLLERWN